MTGDAGAWSRLSVVTVTHDSADVVERCLRSVAAAHQVIVVDNASRDATRERVHGSLPGAVLIENRTNIGFGNACNAGFARANTEFVLFLNPDAALRPGALSELIAAAKRYPEAAIVAHAGSRSRETDVGASLPDDIAQLCEVFGKRLRCVGELSVRCAAQ